MTSPVDFDSTVKNAVKVLSHVWTQVSALESYVDLKLTAAFESAGLQVTGVEYEDATDISGDVTTRYMWRYELRNGSDKSKRGRKPLVARLYFLVRLTPPEAQCDAADSFVPFLGIDITHADLDQYKLDDLSSYWDRDKEKSKIEEPNKFSAATLGAFEWKRGSNGIWGADAYLPLRSINSENVDVVVKLAVELAAYCQSNWRETLGDLVLQTAN